VALQVEHCFSQMKAWFKRHRELAKRRTTDQMIHRALRTITPADMRAYILHDWGSFWTPS
jgi:hypothetical protein